MNIRLRHKGKILEADYCDIQKWSTGNLWLISGQLLNQIKTISPDFTCNQHIDKCMQDLGYAAIVRGDTLK